MIRVEIPYSMLEALGHDTLVGARMCSALKNAGVPIVGMFALRGLKRGRLEWTAEHDKHVYVFREERGDMANDGIKLVRTLKNGARIYMNGAHLVAEEDEEL